MKSRHEFADQMQRALVNFVKTVAKRTAEMSTPRTFFSQYLHLCLIITDPDQSMQA